VETTTTITIALTIRTIECESGYSGRALPIV
jgi:hypothetical protein